MERDTASRGIQASGARLLLAGVVGAMGAVGHDDSEVRTGRCQASSTKVPALAGRHSGRIQSILAQADGWYVPGSDEAGTVHPTRPGTTGWPSAVAATRVDRFDKVAEGSLVGHWLGT